MIERNFLGYDSRKHQFEYNGFNIYVHSFIHIEHLYSASSRELFRGAPDSSTAEKSSLKVIEKRRWQGSRENPKFRREPIPDRGTHHGKSAQSKVTLRSRTAEEYVRRGKAADKAALPKRASCWRVPSQMTEF